MVLSKRYLASLPERTVRASTALAAGAIYEASEVALPRVLRGTKLYQATVARMLRILVEGVGGVQGVYPAEAMPVGELTARKAAGNAVEFASIFAVGFSPLWLLAAASDLAGGSKAYLRVLVGELETAKLLPTGTDVSSYEDLLSKLETGSGVLADAIDVPPIKLDDARASWERLQGQTEDLPNADALASIFEQLQEEAKREGRSLSELSAAVGLAAGRAGLELGNVHVFDYYRDALAAIHDEGLLAFLRRITTPYLKRTGRHFDPKAQTLTDRALDWVDRQRSARDDGRPPAPAGAADAARPAAPPPAPLAGTDVAAADRPPADPPAG